MIPIRAIIKNGFWGIPVFFLLSCDGIQNDPLFLKWKNEKAGLLAVTVAGAVKTQQQFRN